MMQLKSVFSKFFAISILAFATLENQSTIAQILWNSEANANANILKQENGLYLNWYNNNFFKNNEYFLNTVSGYTLFGMQHIPTLLLKPHKNVFVQGGVYLKKDFGTEGLVKIAPYYLVHLQKNGYSLSFGNINANVSHRLYDPIYGNERLMTQHLEEGFSLKVDRKNIYSETWINWEKQQYPYSNFNEQFSVGHNSDIKILNKKAFSLSIPVQALALHSGGQLDTTNLPTSTVVNASLGLQANVKLSNSKKAINQIGFNANYLIYKDLANNSGLPHSNGNAIYANINVQMFQNFRAALGYWQGHQFIAPKGDVLFQSVSSNPTNPNFLSPDRQMLSLTLAYEKRVVEFANLSVRAQPFYDFSNSRLDYFYSLMLTLQPNIKLVKGSKLKLQ